ncbi:hypothetical protein QBC47DRAFT_74708 [Echria macrotheca]|uniref:F-box domain-containing protein n=1 Tax=Echria macrotheca TaxID=438768 RepID=A0AAJ0F826_9PEZI|nr:hypothetical protein QBC47DRAFT_74708 [Echria macrotheca]
MAEIDAISPLESTPAPGPAQPGPSATPDIAVNGERATGPEPEPEGPAKKSSRQRLLRGLQRISSSPTLAQVGRPRASSTPYGRHGTLSCVSLASSSSPFAHPSSGSSYFSHVSTADGSSAPTSIPGSPIPESPDYDGIEAVLAVRKVENPILLPTTAAVPAEVKRKINVFSLWASMPHELKIHVLSFLLPKELVRASRVSKEFYEMCFDGQLWTRFDASEFYKEIPAESLAKIIVAAGPFVKDLNLRGCVQVEHEKRAEMVVKACKNLINATLEGCRNFQRSTLHSLIKSNEKLTYLNLTGLTAVTNATCKIISHSCPQLETFNVSWCQQMDARGIKFVIEGCPKLKDLRVGEIQGFDNRQLAQAIFETNNLERLVLAGCEELTDAALKIMMHGVNPERDILTDRPIVPPRKLRHLDLSRCSRLTNQGVKALGYLVPELEGLQLNRISALTDAALEPILASTPRLTHLDLEELSHLTNSLLSEHLAKAPCAPRLEHLSISYCENLSDAGMLPVLRKCTSLRSCFFDNTRVGDLSLAEAAAMVRGRTVPLPPSGHPSVGLSLTVYDNPNVSWTGVREVLSRNAEKLKGKMIESRHDFGIASDFGPPSEIITLRCFHGWQMTVDEHTKRVLRGDVASARRLERKWADFMQAAEEAGVTGAGGRRRRRRLREAQANADEEAAAQPGQVAGRRRARTAGCSVM